MCVNVVKEALGHSLLKKFAETLQEGDGAVVLGSHVVVAAGFGDDDDQSSLPGGGMMFNPHTSVGKGSEVVLCRWPGHLEDAPGLA